MARVNGGCRSIGMTAAMTASGFRPDGSYRYGPLLDVPVAERSVPDRLSGTLSRIRKGRPPFVYGANVHEPSVAELRSLLQWCASRNIKVIGYLPPFAPTVVAAMRLPPSRYAYLDQLPGPLSQAFRAHNYPFFDFTLFPGAPDAEFVDGVHGSERVGAKMPVEMARQSPVAAEIVDVPRIERHLSSSANPVLLLRRED